MGYFQQRGTHKAKVFEKGRHIVPGSYDLRVVGYKIHVSRKPGKIGQESLICTFEILACDDVDSEPGKTGPKFKAGQQCTWHVDLSMGALADSKIKEHFGTLLPVVIPDIDPDTPAFDESVDACIDENLAEGLVIGAHAYHTITDAGTNFTLVQWYPIPDPADGAEA